MGVWSSGLRVRTLPLVIGLVSGVFLSSPATVSAAYYKSCATSETTGLYADWTYVERIKYAPGFTGAIADVDVRTVTPCSINGGIGDSAGVPAVTIQYSETDVNQIVQIGYGQCTQTGGCGATSYKIPSDGHAHFWYTATDSSGGLAYIADGWYHAPTIGHQYRMRITSTTVNSQPKWEYCIRDKSVGEAYDCTTKNRNWSRNYGNVAWWGTETHNIYSQNGNADSASDIDLRSQYEWQGVWYWTTDDLCYVNTEYIYPSDHYVCAIKSLYDANGDGLLNDKETLWSYTTNY